MFYHGRIYRITEFRSIEELAPRLTDYTHLLCSAYRVGTLLLINDSSSENGAQEFVVVRDGHNIESLTVSWMKTGDLVTYLHELETVPVGSQDWHKPVSIRTNHADLEYCHHCA